MQPLPRTVWRFLKKIKLELPYDPVIPGLGMYPEKVETSVYPCGTVRHMVHTHQIFFKRIPEGI